MNRDLLGTIGAIVEQARQTSARIAERQTEVQRLAAERGHAAAQQRLIRLDHVRTGVHGRTRVDREAALEALLQADSAYWEYVDREECTIVLLDEARIELDRELRAFALDVATLHALGGRSP